MFFGRVLLMRFVLASGLALMLAVGTASQAGAHPHVWVTVETTLLFDAQKAVTGLKQRWTFDEMYSVYSLEGLDKNHDGVFDASSLKALAEENMTSLKDYKYFTEITVDGLALELAPPVEYSAERDAKKILHLTFTLPLKTPLSARQRELKVQVFDPEFYIALKFAEGKAIQLPAAAAATCKTSIEAPTGDATTAKSWGAAYAATAVVACGQ